MTVPGDGDTGLSWLHCNACHRSFEHHNRVSSSGDEMRLLRSDLTFAFTSCGHFFCDNCIRQHSMACRKQGVAPAARQLHTLTRLSHVPAVAANFVCSLCEGTAKTFAIESSVPKSLEVYLRPPTNLLEDSLGVMNVCTNSKSRQGRWRGEASCTTGQACLTATGYLSFS